jgi:hypothetical protein
MNEATEKPEREKDYLARLKQAGIQQLGSGAYARTFQHPYYKNVVVKMFVNSDTAYKKYLNWVVRNQDNKYVPKIIVAANGEYLHKYRLANTTVNFVFMKRYQPLQINQLIQFTEYIRSNVSQSQKLSNKQRKELNYIVNSLSLYSRITWNVIYKTTSDSDLRELADWLINSNIDIDLHRKNMMWDNELKTVIFTDPVA